MAKLCTPSNKRKCRMTHSAGTVFLFLLFSVWCLIFFLCFTAVSESDGPEIRSTCYSHIMNMFAQWIVITASQSKCTRMDYMLMYINSSSLLYFCVCVCFHCLFRLEMRSIRIWFGFVGSCWIKHSASFFSKPKTRLTLCAKAVHCDMNRFCSVNGFTK